MEILQLERRRSKHDYAQRRHNEEQLAPTQGVNNEARKRRANRGRKTNRQSDKAHGAAALFAGNREQNQRKRHRHDNARGKRHHHTCGQNHVEIRCQTSNNAGNAEPSNAAHEQLARGEASHEERIQRNDACLNQRVRAGKPLHGGGGNAGVLHDRWQRRGKKRCVQDDQNGAHKKHQDHRFLLFVQIKSHKYLVSNARLYVIAIGMVIVFSKRKNCERIRESWLTRPSCLAFNPISLGTVLVSCKEFPAKIRKAPQMVGLLCRKRHSAAVSG